MYENDAVLRALLGTLKLQKDFTRIVILHTGEENFHHLLSNLQDASNFVERSSCRMALFMGSCELAGMLRLGAVSVSDEARAWELSRLLHCSQKPWLNSDY